MSAFNPFFRIRQRRRRASARQQMFMSQPPGDADEVVRSAEGEHAPIAVPPVRSLDDLPEDLLLLVVKSTDTLSLQCVVKEVGKTWCLRALQELHTRLARAFGSRHQGTLACIGSLGALKREKFDLASAVPLYRELVKGRRETLGVRHPDTLFSISILGALLREKFSRNRDTDLADLVAAELLYREVLGVQGQTLSAHHPDTITTSTTLASLLAFAGRLGQRTVRPAVKLEQDKQDAFILRQRFDENAFSYEFGAYKFVRRAIMKLMDMTDDELDHLRLNDPDVFEVFERCGGIIIRARHTGTA